MKSSSRTLLSSGLVLSLTALAVAQDPVRFTGAHVPADAAPILDDAALDFDGDGSQDAFGLLSSGTDALVALANTGAGGFVAGPNQLALGFAPIDAATVDLTGDGQVEVVVLEEFAPQSVLVASADAFGVVTELDRFTPVAFAQFVAHGDVDGDGDRDLVLTAADAAFGVWRNDGGGAFSSAGVTALPGGSVDARLVLVDLDGDGATEVVAPGASEVWVFPATGGGSFGSPAQVALAYAAGDPCTMADFDGDGDADVFVPGDDGTDVGSILFGDGLGGLVPGPTQSIVEGVSFRVRDRHGALVEDGDPDLLVVSANLSSNGYPARLNWYENDGTGVLTLERSTVTNRHEFGLRDFDGDGLEDLLQVDEGQPGDVAAWLAAIRPGTSEGGFDLSEYFSVVTPGDEWTLHTIRDLDRDGVPELVGADRSGNLVIVRGVVPGGTPVVELVALDTDSDVTEIEAVDLDGDCLLDLVVRDVSEELLVYDAQGDGTFTLGFTYTYEVPFVNPTGWIELADLDRDGALDLMTDAPNAGIRSVAVHFGDGSGGFGPPTFYGLGLNASGAPTMAEDLDGDGWVDLVVAAGTFVLLNDGTGAFTSASVPGFRATELRDVDEDGDLDGVYVSRKIFFGTSFLEINENLGDLVFTTHLPPTHGEPARVVFADFDGDGEDEIFQEGEYDLISTLVPQRNALLRRTGPIAWSDTQPTYASASWLLSFGLFAEDLDRDGAPDVLQLDREGLLVTWNRMPDADGVCQVDLGFDGPGGATLTACGDRLELGGQTTLEVTGAAPNRTIFFLGSSSLTPTCTLQLDVAPVPLELLLTAPSDGAGTATLPPVTSLGVPFSYFVQAAYLDATLPGRVGLTNAVRLDFLP